jgi:hypothetical protein
VSAPGGADLAILFDNDEVEAGLAQTRADRQACRTCADDRDGRRFCQAMLL